MIRRFLVALALSLVPVTAATAQALSPAERAAVDRLVETTLADTGVPSASIAIVRGGRIVLARAYGKQSERGGLADARLPYPIASISKQFTAAALLLLEDEGKLRLDDPVARYVPGITAGDRITIRQLLSHTSGLQDYWPQDYSFAAMARPVTPQQIIDRWAKKPLDFAPGTQWQYSNTGYVVAGQIAEKVAGMPLLDFLRQRLFAPLGIRAVDLDRANGAGFPQGYKRFALGPVRPQAPTAPGWLYAAGELAMSAEDLAKWDVARLDRSILPADDWAAQEAPVALADGSSNGYGLGIGNGTSGGHRYLEHSGEAAGFLSKNIIYPDDRTAIVVLTNSWFSDACPRIAAGLARIVLPPASATAADADADAVALAQARRVFDQLRTGRLDRTLLTDDANTYFDTTAVADYRRSLAPLGPPIGFVATSPARLRGGFVNRTYRATWPGQTLAISTYAEPAEAKPGSARGTPPRFEQFLVTPAQ